MFLKNFGPDLFECWRLILVNSQGVGKIHWRKKWQPTPVFLPGKSHGQKSLADYIPWGLSQSDMTEELIIHQDSY